MDLVWLGSGVVLVIVVVAAMLIRVRNQRRHVQALQDRLSVIEDQLAASAETVAASHAPGGHGPDDDGAALSNDALAGWTSHVGHVLAHDCQPASLADQALVAVYQRIEDPIRPADLAQGLDVSLRTLERGLARDLDCSPGDLILTVKMREARRMLSSGRFRVGEVAHRLAFSDAAHFSRRYRRFFRCVPSADLPSGPRAN